jgi:CBS domain-containing protein
MDEAIRDVMTRDVECARQDMTMQAIAKLMKDKNLGSLPVCEDRKVIGMITDRDVTIRGVAEGRDPGSTEVADLMSREVVCVKEDARLADAEKLMHDRQLRRLPVINEQGELVGYLSMAKIARTESPEQIGKVMKGVSQPSKPAPLHLMEQKRRRKAQ